VRAFAAGFRLQLRVVRSDADYVMPLATIPLFAITFLAIVRHAGRDDLTGYAVMAPVLIALEGARRLLWVPVWMMSALKARMTPNKNGLRASSPSDQNVPTSKQ
jgi:hypothetical protein